MGIVFIRNVKYNKALIADCFVPLTIFRSGTLLKSAF